MPSTELANMVMIEDPATGKVLVQKRVKSWKGYSFPGGHVEDNESVYDSAVREVREETGLVVRNLTPCGIVHWFNRKTGDRFIIFNYKTRDFEGELLSNDEGENTWMDIAALREAVIGGAKTNSFHYYFRLYFGDGNDPGQICSEAFAGWDDDDPWEMVYR
jgi:8-oxo-dGTP diphosphatase